MLKVRKQYRKVDMLKDLQDDLFIGNEFPITLSVRSRLCLHTVSRGWQWGRCTLRARNKFYGAEL